MNKKVKTAIYVCVILWLVVIAQLGTTWLTFSGGNITQAFTRNQLVIEKSIIEAKIYLGTQSLDETKLKQTFGNSTEVSTITQGGLRYGHISIKGSTNLDEWMTARRRLQSELAATKQTDIMVTAYVEGHTNRLIEADEQQKMGASLLKHLGALQVSEHYGNNFYSLYGFTTGLTDSIRVNGRRVNMNVAMSQDEKKKQTRVYLGIPMVDTEY